MKLAIVGCGSIGMRHLKNALALGCEVFAHDADVAREAMACELGAKRLARGYIDGLKISNAVDAVMVCTPYDRHLDAAKWAVANRLPLFVEKPLGALDQFEDWRRLVQASESLVTQVGYQCRFHPALRMLGRNGVGTMTVHCDMGRWPGHAYGPALLELSHEIDLALASGADPDVQFVEHEHAYRWRVRLGGHWSVELCGSCGTYLRRWSVGTTAVQFGHPDDLGDHMYVDELKHFLECVQTGRQTDVPLKDGLRVLEVCAQIEAMVRQHA